MKRLEEKEVRNDHCSDQISDPVFVRWKGIMDMKMRFVFKTENGDVPVSVLEGM